MFIVIHTDSYGNSHTEVGDTIDRCMEILEQELDEPAQMHDCVFYTATQLEVSRNVTYTVTNFFPKPE